MRPAVVPAAAAGAARARAAVIPRVGVNELFHGASGTPPASAVLYAATAADALPY